MRAIDACPRKTLPRGDITARVSRVHRDDSLSEERSTGTGKKYAQPYAREKGKRCVDTLVVVLLVLILLAVTGHLHL